MMTLKKKEREIETNNYDHEIKITLQKVKSKFKKKIKKKIKHFRVKCNFYHTSKHSFRIKEKK